MNGGYKYMAALLLVSLLVIPFAGCVGEESQSQSAGSASSAEVYRLKMSVAPYPPGTYEFQLMEYFANTVKNMSNGRVQIELYGPGELVPVTDILEATAQGTLDLAGWGIYYDVDRSPVFGIGGNTPGPLTTPFDVIYWTREVEDILAKELEKQGVVYIDGVFCFRPPEPFMSKEVITSLHDLNGKMVRTTGTGADFYSTFGAQPVMMAGGEIYQALQLGTVDGAEYSDFYNNYLLGFHEIVKAIIEPPPGVNLHCQALSPPILIANPNSWAKLPDDVKEMIRAAVSATYVKSAYDTVRLNEESKEFWRQAGVQIIQLSEEGQRDIINTAVKIYVEYAKKGPEVQEFVKRHVKIWRELGYDEWANALESALKSEGLM